MIPTFEEYHRLELTLTWIADNITYKPNTRITFTTTHNHIEMSISTLSVFDSSKPGFPEIDNVSGYVLGHRDRFITSPQGMVTTLLRDIEHAVMKYERHEVMEFLRVRNVHLTDPHPDQPGTEVVLEPWFGPSAAGIQPEVPIFTGIKARQS